MDKLSVREIAERMQTTEKAVESVLFRARRDFRERVVKAEQREDMPKPGMLNGEPSSSAVKNNGDISNLSPPKEVHTESEGDSSTTGKEQLTQS